MTDKIESKVFAPLVFVDFETDGLRRDRKGWEVAAVRREPDGTETPYEAFIAGVDLADAEPTGLRIGRFYERHPEYANRIYPDDAPTPEDYPGGHLAPELEVARMLEWMTRGAHWVGNVPDFDTEVTKNMFESHGLAPAWHYHLIDVENLAVGFLAAAVTRGQAWFNPEIIVPPYSSEALSEALGVAVATPEERHTAMGDVRWSMRMYDAIMSRGRHDG